MPRKTPNIQIFSRQAAINAFLGLDIELDSANEILRSHFARGRFACRLIQGGFERRPERRAELSRSLAIDNIKVIRRQGTASLKRSDNVSPYLLGVMFFP
jgi:hypothetical protein